MGTSRRIKVMLSSRCNDLFSEDEGVPLTEIRRQLKAEIESQTLFNFKAFEVWINEDAEALDHTEDSWEVCLRQVRECDILIVLFNGDAGWAHSGAEIGICHAEYAEGLRVAPAKVRLLSLPKTPRSLSKAEQARGARYEDAVNKASGFRGSEIATVDDLKTSVRKTLADAVLTQTRRGAENSQGGRYDLGAALEWTRMDFATRRSAMETEVKAALADRPGSKKEQHSILIEVAGTLVLVDVHAVPAAMSVAAAREPIGRPHLLDHKRVQEIGKRGGPLHVIACHRSVTETQATSLLGFPDATVVSSPFGIYVADEVQKTQFVFLANCRDSVQARHAVQRFFEWLSQAGEAQLLAQRALARARIVAAISKEQKI